MYLVLFAVVMAALGGSFATIKIRQRALSTRAKLIDTRLTEAEGAMAKFEHLQAKRKTMMKTALTTAELLETVPKSVLLASLTNNLPPGVSLLQLDVAQKEIRRVAGPANTSKYKKAQADKTAAKSKPSREKMLETHIARLH
jgi:Tfp pilus assembly protein PilN